MCMKPAYMRLSGAFSMYRWWYRLRPCHRRLSTKLGLKVTIRHFSVPYHIIENSK